MGYAYEFLPEKDAFAIEYQGQHQFEAMQRYAAGHYREIEAAEKHRREMQAEERSASAYRCQFEECNAMAYRLQLEAGVPHAMEYCRQIEAVEDRAMQQHRQAQKVHAMDARYRDADEIDRASFPGPLTKEMLRRQDEIRHSLQPPHYLAQKTLGLRRPDEEMRCFLEARESRREEMLRRQGEEEHRLLRFQESRAQEIFRRQDEERERLLFRESWMQEILRRQEEERERLLFRESWMQQIFRRQEEERRHRVLFPDPLMKDWRGALELPRPCDRLTHCVPQKIEEEDEPPRHKKPIGFHTEWQD